MDNLKKRILTGIFLVVSILLALSVGKPGFLLLMLLINFLSLGEFYRLFHTDTILPRKAAGIVLSTTLLIISAAVFSGQASGKIISIVILMAFAIFVAELYWKAGNPFQNLAITFLGLIVITIPLAFFIAIGFMPFGSGEFHAGRMTGYFLILWAADSGAYFTGKYLGKHALFERISPHKTWEGSFGGMLCAQFAAYMVACFISPGIVHWAIMAAIITIAGSFGDLVKSMMKRSLHIKDSGTILPGHGGMLDRFDSLLGSAPVVFCYLLLKHYV